MFYQLQDDYIYTCIYKYVYIYVYIFIYIYILCICIFMYVCIYIYTYQGFLTWEGTLLHHPVVIRMTHGEPGAPREDRRATPRSVLEHRPGQGI